MRYEETRYGFSWGAADLTRMCGDDKKGWVLIGIDTPRDKIQVYVTKTGKVRVYNKKGEMK